MACRDILFTVWCLSYSAQSLCTERHVSTLAGISLMSLMCKANNLVCIYLLCRDSCKDPITWQRCGFAASKTTQQHLISTGTQHRGRTSKLTCPTVCHIIYTRPASFIWLNHWSQSLSEIMYLSKCAKSKDCIETTDLLVHRWQGLLWSYWFIWLQITIVHRLWNLYKVLQSAQWWVVLRLHRGLFWLRSCSPCMWHSPTLSHIQK